MANEFLTVSLTDRRPAKIRLEDWPIIAKASDTDFDGQYDFQANRTAKWSIKVRQHADGRAIVYGVHDYTTAFQGESCRNLRGGELLLRSDDLPAAILRVAADMESRFEGGEEYGPGVFPRLAQECIADLPAEDLTDAGYASESTPDVNRLTWLAALISDYEEHLPGVDPQAEQTCLSECRALLDTLRRK